MSDFKMDAHFIDNLKRSSDMRDFLHDVARDVTTEAQRIAKSEAYDDGDYHDGIETLPAEESLTGEGFIGRVNANDFKSNWIEFGTIRQPPRAPLRRALETVLGPDNVTQEQENIGGRST